MPKQLIRLASPDKATAMKASHELWCGLCHQHVQIGTAALPAFPFLLEVMSTADDSLVFEILDIVLGFAKGVNHKRRVDFQKASGYELLPDPEWVNDLRKQLFERSHHFQVLAVHVIAGIAESANAILQELSEGT